MNIRIAFALALVLTPVASQADGLLPAEVKESLIGAALSGFWGRARDSSGMIIQPASEAERTTVPVNRSSVDRALSIGETSGLAEWCGLAWTDNLLNMTRSARQAGRSDKQVAFLTVAHGMALESVSGSLKRSRQCDAQMRAKVKGLVERMQTTQHDF